MHPTSWPEHALRTLPAWLHGWESPLLVYLARLARSFIGISAEGCDRDLYSVWVKLCSLLLQGAGSPLMSTSEAHWLASLNSRIRCCLTITPLVGVMALNHIQMSTSDRLSEPPSSCRMAVGTPSGLCCHKDSIAHISSGVPSRILKHNGFFDW